jgi:hypothetical protein
VTAIAHATRRASLVHERQLQHDDEECARDWHRGREGRRAVQARCGVQDPVQIAVADHELSDACEDDAAGDDEDRVEEA